VNVGRIEKVSDSGEMPVLYDAQHNNEENQDRRDVRRESAATSLVNLARSRAELFHTGEDTFATIQLSGHLETYPIRSRGFRSCLGKLFFEAQSRAASGEAISSALATLDGYARFDSPEKQAHVRVAGEQDRVWLDLGDPCWRQIEIDAAGWHILESKDSPVRFRRPHGMLALPFPRRGGSFADLRRFLNVETDADFYLVGGFAIGAMHPSGPYPVLILHGEQGTAKSTTTRVLRSLTDPNLGALRSEPREPRDLMIAARNGWMIAFDNISKLEPWLSDCLCRMSTGGGFSSRTLYTDADEVIFQAKRPVILNGIEELATRGDLLDRSLLLYLPRINDTRRRDERTFNLAFEAAQPYLFGALLEAVSASIRHHSSIDFKELPRMADFARWVSAAETKVGWPPGAFVEAYRENRKAANELPLENPVADVLRKLALPWLGTATDLLKHLATVTGEEVSKSKNWPSTGQNLSNLLRRLAPHLAPTGILVDFGKRSPDKQRRRLISLSENMGATSSTSSAPSTKPIVSDAADAPVDEIQPFSGAKSENLKMFGPDDGNRR
jgi:hypothetical protein